MMEEELYKQIGSEIIGSTEGNLFGKPCYNLNKKAFICYFEKAMVFKLNGSAHKEALELEESILFDPSKKGRPMKEWVQIPYMHKDLWASFAQAAKKYNVLQRKTRQ